MNVFKNTGRVCTVLALAAATMLSSCLKDTSPGSVDLSKSPALIGFQYAGLSATPYTAAILPNPGVVFSGVEVTLSVPSLTLSSTVTAKVTEDVAGENAYKTANAGTHILPASDYSFSGAVTISPGQQVVKVPITFAADKIDFTQNYIIGLQLTDASGAIIATNLNEAIVIITLKSPYQGTYTVNGTMSDHTNPNLTGIYPVAGVYLQTQTATKVQYIDPKVGAFHEISSGGQLSYYGNFGPSFTFDPKTNKVIAVSNNYPGNSQGRDAVIDPAVTPTSSGTPGVVGFTFTVGYIMTQGGAPRTYFDETFVLTAAN